MAPIPKPIGLNDPRVDICFDRGNQHYDDDHPVVRSNTRIILQNSGSEVFNIIRKELEEQEVEKDEKYFVPRRYLKEVFTPGRLLASIQQLWKDIPEKEQQELCTRVLYKARCWKVFLMFIIAELEDLLPELWRKESGADDSLRLSDRCLPLVSINPQGLITCQNKNHSHHIPNRQAGCVSRKDRKYLKEASYAINAVYFKLPRNSSKTHVHYCLDPNDVLPYRAIPCGSSPNRRQISGMAATSGGAEDTRSEGDATTDNNPNGGFGEITRVIFEPGHFNFGPLGVSLGDTLFIILLLCRCLPRGMFSTAADLCYRAMMAEAPRPLQSKSYMLLMKMLLTRSWPL